MEKDETLSGEQYRLDIGGAVIITASGSKGAAHAGASLLQLLLSTDAEGCLPRVPCGSFKDCPDAPYRGLMLDVARSFHSPALLEKMILVCYWYKINFLHLHLTDDAAFTFPWNPLLPRLEKGRYYTAGQLARLDAFAAAHGVTLLPEIDLPGHSGFLIKAMPGLFAPLGAPESCGVVCAGREAVYAAIDGMIGEVCSVFKTSPYIHIGGDEVNAAFWDSCGDCAAYKKEHDLSSSAELYRHFINRLNGIVKKHGRKSIVWEGFAKDGSPAADRDIAVMEFESQYNPPQDLAAAGYKIINCSWQPLYYVPKYNWPAEKIYEWNMYRWESCWSSSAAYPDGIQLDKSADVAGAQLCSWENPAENVEATVRARLPALAERVWNTERRMSLADFISTADRADAELGRFLAKSRNLERKQ